MMMVLIRLALDTLYRCGLVTLLNCGEIPFLLNSRGLTGVGAEIGVKYGQFSEYLLTHWQGRLLYSIDPWREFNPDEYHDDANVPQEEQDHIFESAKARLSRFKERSTIL